MSVSDLYFSCSRIFQFSLAQKIMQIYYKGANLSIIDRWAQLWPFYGRVVLHMSTYIIEIILAFPCNIRDVWPE